MVCRHTTIWLFGHVSWCTRCGAARVDAHWHLPEHEQLEVQRAEACPFCEFGEPLPVEMRGGQKIWRWTCGHWIDRRQHAPPAAVDS